MLLPLAYFGAPILRKKCDPVIEITPEIRQLVEDMIETMNKYDGIGLAAPQVHHNLRLFITQVPVKIAEATEEEEEKYDPGELIVFINPKILSYSEESWIRGEGCLSIPDIYGSVVRPTQITVEATDLEGKRFTRTLSGLDARAFMHENDHINGVLFIDRLSKKERDTIDPLLRKLKKGN